MKIRKTQEKTQRHSLPSKRYYDHTKQTSRTNGTRKVTDLLADFWFCKKNYSGIQGQKWQHFCAG